MRHLNPASHRGTITQARPLPTHLRPLLGASLSSILQGLSVQFPLYTFRDPESADSPTSSPTDTAAVMPQTHRPRLLITGASGMGQRHLAKAVIHALEGFPTFTLDAATLMADTAGLAQVGVCGWLEQVRWRNRRDGWFRTPSLAPSLPPFLPSSLPSHPFRPSSLK